MHFFVLYIFFLYRCSHFETAEKELLLKVKFSAFLWWRVWRIEPDLVIICVEQEQNLRLEIEKAREKYKSLLDEHVSVSAQR